MGSTPSRVSPLRCCDDENLYIVNRLPDHPPAGGRDLTLRRLQRPGARAPDHQLQRDRVARLDVVELLAAQIPERSGVTCRMEPPSTDEIGDSVPSEREDHRERKDESMKLTTTTRVSVDGVTQYATAGGQR